MHICQCYLGMYVFVYATGLLRARTHTVYVDVRHLPTWPHSWEQPMSDPPANPASALGVAFGVALGVALSDRGALGAWA